MREYELTANMFLTHYLNVELEYSNKKWTHVKLYEIIRNRGLGEIIIENGYEKYGALRDSDSIYKGKILLVRDQKGKLEPYYNPYKLENISENYMGLNNEEVLLMRIKILTTKIESTYLKTKFTLENLKEEYNEYITSLEQLEKEKQELIELKRLYELVKLGNVEKKSKVYQQKRRGKYDKYKRK